MEGDKMLRKRLHRGIWGSPVSIFYIIYFCFSYLDDCSYNCHYQCDDQCRSKTFDFKITEKLIR